MPKRNPDHVEAQRFRIMRATIKCVADKGVDAASIASICRRAGLSAGALYVHFRNKDEITAETVRYNAPSMPTAEDWSSLKTALADVSNLG